MRRSEGDGGCAREGGSLNKPEIPPSLPPSPHDKRSQRQGCPVPRLSAWNMKQIQKMRPHDVLACPTHEPGARSGCRSHKGNRKWSMFIVICSKGMALGKNSFRKWGGAGYSCPKWGHSPLVSDFILGGGRASCFP